MHRLLLLPLLLPAVACGSASPDSSPDAGDDPTTIDGGYTPNGDANLSADASPTGTDAAADGADATTSSPDAASGSPNIALAAACAPLPADYHPSHIDEASPDASLNLLRTTVDTTTHPQALCNDGTPAVYYVRRGNGTGANRWLIHLQGGGACASADVCYERWCSIGTSYNASKMSTAWAPGAMKGEGLFAQRSDNSFANWNHVFVYYCSSDSWTGTATSTQVPAASYAAYSANFQGHNIVAAVVSELKNGAISDDSSRSLPSLDDATAVLLTGTSAGSGGVRANADWVGTELRTTNADVTFGAVFDAALTPDNSDYLSASEYDTMMRARNTWARLARQSHVDASCVAHHTATGDTHVCEDLVHVARHHISTPMFLRMDLRDQNPLPWLNPITGAPLGNTSEFAVAVAAQLDWFTKLGTPASEAEEPGAVTVAPGIFGPQCGSHGAILTARVFKQRLGGANASVNTHDVLVNWALGITPTQLIDDPSAPSTDCGN